MNTTQLECFVQVALNLSFRRAAEELHLSQPTVSKQIASLETELGGSLFVRTTRQVLLTALGEQFLRDAQEILRLTYAAQERASRAASGPELVIAYSDANECMRLSPVLDRLRHKQQELHILLQQGPRDTNITQLEREQVDVVMGFETEGLATGGLAFECLATDGLSCIVRRDSPLAKCDVLGPEDVEGLPQVICLPPSLRRRGYQAQASLPHTKAAQTTRCSTSSEAYALVDAGFGYALVPSLYTMPDPYHAAIRWRSSASVNYGLYHRKNDSSTLLGQFLEAASDTFASLKAGRPLPESWKPGV